jgi:hypothetical protein
LENLSRLSARVNLSAKLIKEEEWPALDVNQELPNLSPKEPDSSKDGRPREALCAQDSDREEDPSLDASKTEEPQSLRDRESSEPSKEVSNNAKS